MTAPALDVGDIATLLAAVARQWVNDARNDDGELTALAAWLNMDPCELRRRLSERHCKTCGATLPERTSKRGQQRVYCSAACHQKALSWRNKIHVPLPE
ncbi:MAG TPA: hypothetical protein VL334_19735 [Anaerolineae bacterium]|nr:hypothetical protein [Anaerolineae bacterium]